MRKLVYLLALTSVTFAGTTVYFARQLAEERSRAAPPAALPARMATASVPVREAPLERRAEPSKPKPAAAAAPRPREFFSGAMINGQPMSEEDMKKMQADFSRQFLAQLADPEQREELLAQRKMMIRQMYPRVDQVLALTPEEYSRFIELSAQQQLDMQESSSRCTLDPDCRVQDMHRDMGESRSQDIDNLLGADRKQKFETYKNTMSEREAVAQLRNRLPDAQRLGDERAESLIQVLAEERNAIHREAMQQGLGSSGFGFGAGMVFTSGDQASFEERYATAKQNSQRMRDRAAQYLTPEQMRAFNEMQDETLLSLRSALRQSELSANHQEGISFSAVAVPAPAPAN